MAITVDQWTEFALIDITKQGGSAVQFASFTDTIDISMGDKDIEVTPLISGGRVVKFVPEDVTELTIEGYAIGVDSSSSNGLSQYFYGDSTSPSSGQLSITNSLQRFKFRVAILWTDNLAQTTASGAVAATYAAMRFEFKNAYLTSCKFDYTDDIQKCTVMFKVPPFTRAGVANITAQESDGTAELAALAAYT